MKNSSLCQFRKESVERIFLTQKMTESYNIPVSKTALEKIT